MRKLSEMNLLYGQTEEITCTELRKTPGDIIEQVRLGKVFFVTKGKGRKRVAMISQPGATAVELASAVRHLERSKFGPNE